VHAATGRLRVIDHLRARAALGGNIFSPKHRARRDSRELRKGKRGGRRRARRSGDISQRRYRLGSHRQAERETSRSVRADLTYPPNPAILPKDPRISERVWNRSEAEIAPWAEAGGAMRL
jgi:hypothetical protein